jgi:CRP-like cAMP-binding protein
MKSRAEAVSEIKEFFASIPLFAKLSESTLLALAEACTLRQLEAGVVLFLQSDPSETAYVVRTGKISIVLYSQDGREMVINEMQPGDLFGELGILTRKTRSTSAIARTDSELVVIPSQVFRKLIDSESSVAVRLLEVTANRLQMSGQRESALAFLDAQARLARLLLELEQQELKKGYITISQDELAHRTGLIRQTVAKALGKWRRAGWLITGRGRILILNRRALEELGNILSV